MGGREARVLVEWPTPKGPRNPPPFHVKRRERPETTARGVAQEIPKTNRKHETAVTKEVAIKDREVRRNESQSMAWILWDLKERDEETSDPDWSSF